MLGNMVYKCDNMRDISDDIYSFLESELGTDFLKYDDIQVDDNATSCHLPKDILDVARFIANPQREELLGYDGTPVAMGDDIRVNCSKFGNLSSTDCCYRSRSHCGALNKTTLEDGKLQPNFEEPSLTLECDSCTRMSTGSCAVRIYTCSFSNRHCIPSDCVTPGELSDGMYCGLEDDKSVYLTGGVLESSPVFPSDAESLHEIPPLHYNPNEDSSLQKLGPVYHSQNLENNGMIEMSNPSKAATSLPDSTSDETASFLENMTIDELHEAFRRTFGRDTYINDKEWLKRRIMFGLESIKEIENDTSITESSLPSNEQGDGSSSIFFSNFDLPERAYGSLMDIYGSESPLTGNYIGQGDPAENAGMICSSDVDTVKVLNLGDRHDEIRTRKRLRKPTRRYIEELSKNKSKSCTKKITTQALTGDRDLCATKNNVHSKESSIMPFVHSETPVTFDNQFPSAVGCHRGRPRKNSSLLVKVSKGNKELKPLSSGPRRCEDSEPSESELPDDMTISFSSKVNKSGGRRKHHRQWTLSEVIKLIDGVSRYGVGRWTEIKRIFFSSSVYRTSVDLKDKWRNLLRATDSHIYGKKMVERSKKHTCNQMPHSVSRRVRELSTMYPYPRGRKSRSPLISDLALVSTNGDETSTLPCNLIAVHNGLNPSTTDLKVPDSMFAH